MLPAGNCVRVVLGMDKADLAIFGDIHRHHRRGRCRFVVDHEVRPLQVNAQPGAELLLSGRWPVSIS